MCNVCHKEICCCEKVISKQGLPGPKGPQGLQGIPGPSNVFSKSSIAEFDYDPGITPGYVSLINYTIATPGNYMVMFEGDMYPVAGENETVNYELRKNGVVVSNNQRQVKFNERTPAETKKMSLNGAILSLSANDVVAIYVECGKTFKVGGRNLTLVKVSNLTIL